MLAASLLAILVAPISFPSQQIPTAAPPVLAVAVQGRPQAPGAEEARQAMQKLGWLAGRWQGTASITQGPGGAMQVQQAEDVRFKVFGTVLLIEGVGREQGAEGKPGEIVFEALATLGYDAQVGRYVMRAHTERGSVDPTVEVGDQEMTWSFSPGGGKVRYHIRLDEQGRWHETGEFSRDDGQTWVKFIEMTLTKLDEPAP